MDPEGRQSPSELPKRYRLRSSLKRTNIDECENATLPAPPRRVSFAPSSTIKPFVNDGEITIWDNSYQKDIDRTESTLESLPSGESTKNVNLHSEMGQTDLGSNSSEKENVNVVTKKPVRRNKKPLAALDTGKLSSTVLATVDMEFTCPSAVHVDLSAVQQDEPMDISLPNRTVYPENDMSLTLKFMQPKIVEAAMEKTEESNMEFTCQFSSKPIITKSPVSDDAMEFTCQFAHTNAIVHSNQVTDENRKSESGQLPLVPSGTTILRDDSMELTCTSETNDCQAAGSESNTQRQQVRIVTLSGILPDNDTIRNEHEMEFTCQFPATRVVHTESTNRCERTSMTMVKNNVLEKQDCSLHQGKNQSRKGDPKEITWKRNADSDKVSQRALGDVQVEENRVQQCDVPEDMNTQTLRGPQLESELEISFDADDRVEPNLDTIQLKVDDVQKSDKAVEFSCKNVVPVTELKTTDDGDACEIAIERSSNTYFRKSNIGMDVEKSRITDSSITATKSSAVTYVIPEISESTSNLEVETVPADNMNSICVKIDKEEESLNEQTYQIPSEKIGFLKGDINFLEGIAGVEESYAVDNLHHSLIIKQEPCDQMLIENQGLVRDDHAVAGVEESYAVDTLHHSVIIKQEPCDQMLIKNEGFVRVDHAVEVKTESLIESASGPPDLLLKTEVLTSKVIQFGSIPIALDNTELSEMEQPNHVENDSALAVLEEMIITNKNVTNIEDQCSLINLTDNSLIDDPPPATKVIYSEPMKMPKASTSMLHLTSLHGHSTVDNTQNLLEAANTTLDQSASVINRILGREIQFLKYEPVAIDFTKMRDFLERQEAMDKEIKEYMASYKDLPPPKKPLESRLSVLSLGSPLSPDATSPNESSDGLANFFGDDSSSLDQSPQSLQQQIEEFFAKSKEGFLKLELLEAHKVVFTAFAEAVWFQVMLHEEDDTVTKIVSLSALEKSPGWTNYCLYNFLAKYIMSKLKMTNARASLGLRFDMLSFLEYVHMVVEKCFDFCYEFILLKSKESTLKIDDECTFSFQIRCLRTITWWTIEFKMVSPENFQLDSLRATSKWSEINEEHIVTIMRNTEPGMGCLKSFVKSVGDYFQRIHALTPTAVTF